MMQVQNIGQYINDFDGMTTEAVVDLMKENGYIAVECRCPKWQAGVEQWCEQTCKDTVVYHAAMRSKLIEGSKGPTYLTGVDRYIWYFKNSKEAILFKLKWS